MEMIRYQIRNEAMAPTLQKGDKLICRRISLEDVTYSDINYIFLVVLNNGLEAVRRIKDKGEEILLIADNKEWGNQAIPKNYIQSLYKVIASARLMGY